MLETALLSDELGKKLTRRIDNDILTKQRRKESEKDIFDKKKVMEDVLDRTSIMALSKLINSGTISYVNGIVGSGKESKLYWAVDPSGNNDCHSKSYRKVRYYTVFKIHSSAYAYNQNQYSYYDMRTRSFLRN
jgi:serine/threonine-protein kinase RIO1